MPSQSDNSSPGKTDRANTIACMPVNMLQGSTTTGMAVTACQMHWKDCNRKAITIHVSCVEHQRHWFKRQASIGMCAISLHFCSVLFAAVHLLSWIPRGFDLNDCLLVMVGSFRSDNRRLYRVTTTISAIPRLANLRILHRPRA